MLCKLHWARRLISWRTLGWLRTLDWLRTFDWLSRLGAGLSELTRWAWKHFVVALINLTGGLYITTIDKVHWFTASLVELYDVATKTLTKAFGKVLGIVKANLLFGKGAASSKRWEGKLHYALQKDKRNSQNCCHNH